MSSYPLLRPSSSPSPPAIQNTAPTGLRAIPSKCWEAIQEFIQDWKEVNRLGGPSQEALAWESIREWWRSGWDGDANSEDKSGRQEREGEQEEPVR